MTSNPNGGYLDGKVLIAMPSMDDKRFARAIIYVCAHSEEGAMGLVINKPARDLNLSTLLVQLDIMNPTDSIRPGDGAEEIKVFRGGPVETARGFVLHSPDIFIDNSTLKIADGICLTVTVDILHAIATGNGPESSLLALGYTGWSAGQLENEIQSNGWLTCEADPELVFSGDFESKYDRAMRRIGIDQAMLSSQTGHA